MKQTTIYPVVCIYAYLTLRGCFLSTYLNGSENYEVTAFDDLDEAKADFKHFTYPVIVLLSTLMYFKTGM